MERLVNMFLYGFGVVCGSCVSSYERSLLQYYVVSAGAAVDKVGGLAGPGT